MEIEKDPYSLIKYINVINMSNDGYGDPTIHAFVEMGLLTTNDKLICTINNTPYECFIDKNDNGQYVLSYQNKIQNTNVLKFIIKLSKLIQIKIRYMGVAFNRIHRVSDNKTLFRLCFHLQKNFQERITKMLMASEFGIWDIHTSYDHSNKKFTFICKSNTKYDDILQIINNNNDMNYTDLDDDLSKEKQQLYSLLKHESVQIIYQPKTDEDIIKFDRGDDDIS